MSNFFINKFRSKPQIQKFDNGFLDKYFAEDPLFTGFSLYIDPSSPILNPKETTQFESAERYFYNNDDLIRANYVKEFRERVISLVTEHQYFLQNISGINTLYNKTIGQDEIELTIDTLESLDMRITKIKELYHLITYDYNQEKELLPKNLQWMTVNILINDSRTLGKFIDGKIKDITPSLDTIIYTIENCRFNFDDGHSYLDDVSNSEPEMGTNSLKIVGGHSHMKRSRIGLVELLTLDVKGSSLASARTNTRSVTTIDADNEELKKLSTRISQENVRSKVEHKLSITELLKTVGSKVVTDIKNAGIREAHDILVNKLINIKDKSRLGNVFFRGAGAEFANNGDFMELVRGSINDGLLPDLDANIVDIIMSGDNMTFKDNQDLYFEIMKLNDANALDSL